MRILFNTHNVGLGNNGGSRTVVRCAETLAELGQEVVIYGNLANKFSWHYLKVPYLRAKKPPTSDVSIACGFHSLPSVLKSKSKVKINYLRGFEKWQASEPQLLASYKQANCLVNSEWLYKKLKQHGIKSTIMYQGLDFDEFSVRPGRGKVLGGLYHQRHKTKRHKDIETVAKMIGYPLRMLNREIHNPTRSKLCKFYNTIRVWMAPTELEGLHNCPMEACLSGCVLVATDAFSSGMSDYAIPNETALVYPKRDVKRASEYVKQLMEDAVLRQKLFANMKETLNTKIGSRQKNMRKLISWCEDRL